MWVHETALEEGLSCGGTPLPSIPALDRQEVQLTRQPGRSHRLFAATLAAIALIGAACGGDSNTDAASTTVLPKGPKIVSLSATATEMLFAIGAGDQVVAVDDTSNYPSAAPKTDLNALQPNVEAIAKYKPDLVVFSNDVGNLSDNLRRLSIDALLHPAAATLDDTYAQISELGTKTDHAEEAADLVKKMRGDVAALVAQVPKRQRPLTFFHELDNTLYTVTSETFIGQMYKLAGLDNIADATKDKAGGYPQLSAEFVIKAKPDLVFLADVKCCKQSAETVAQRPGWRDVPAVKNGQVIALDDDIASRWGPRVVDLLQTIIDAVRKSGTQ